MNPAERQIIEEYKRNRYIKQADECIERIEEELAEHRQEAGAIDLLELELLQEMRQCAANKNISEMRTVMERWKDSRRM